MKKYSSILLLLTLIACTVTTKSFTQTQSQTEPVSIDFSYAGYGGGGLHPPFVASVVNLSPTGGDDTRLIQDAIDRMALLPLTKEGFRGTIQLSSGTFRIAGQLNISATGIIIRGNTNKNYPTTLVATGNDRRPLVSIGKEQVPTFTSSISVTDEIVPAGSKTIKLEHIQDIKVGDHVVITRPSTPEWIRSIGMDTIKSTFAELRLHWSPGSRNIVWDRIVTAIDPSKKQITLDAPITTSLEKRYGGGTVSKIQANYPIKNIGIENVNLESEWNSWNPKDEEHSWFAVIMNNTEDAWISNVSAKHFVNGFFIKQRTRKISIENCNIQKPVAEIGGYRRLNFWIEGQQVLVRNCLSEEGSNDFAVGFCAGGPNVYLNCVSSGSHGPSGSFESWSSGTLYENVSIKGSGLKLAYDMTRAQAGGWTAVNSVVWNCNADSIVVNGPVGASNFTYTSSKPLYRAQLANRLGRKNAVQFFSDTYQRQRLNVNPSALRTVSILEKADNNKSLHLLQIVNGRFVINGKTIWGGAVNDAWWLGQTTPASALDAGISITRFVPGKTGPGLTEDLPTLATRIVKQGTPFYQSGPSLWYDRRRDEHSITERMDGNVWAAFYEMPWQRSGKGKAWDGLSLFDLTKFNPWFYNRTKEFAQLSDEKGIVLYHNLYNTHNLLEIGAHWCDYPWRPANNINQTGLPEPMPLEPRDRLHVANQFYNVDDSNRLEHHHNFIFHVLDQLASYNNIIFGVGFQFSGPLAFQQFFQKTVAEWEKKNNRTVRLMLATSKDITDSILADPQFAKQVAVIDMRYWQYRPDGKLWAPPGGQNLAFREMNGKEFGKASDAAPPTTPIMVYKQVREYRDKYPDKAILAWHNGVGPIPILMAGGAQALTQNPTAGHGQGRVIDTTRLDRFVQQYLSGVLMNMKPKDNFLENAEYNWMLADANSQNQLVYSLKGTEIYFLKQPVNITKGTWFNPHNGSIREVAAKELWKSPQVIQKPNGEDWLLLLQ